MEPMSRPNYTQSYIHIGTDGHSVDLMRSGGYHVRSGCKYCMGNKTLIECQYGPACSKRVGSHKRDINLN